MPRTNLPPSILRPIGQTSASSSNNRRQYPNRKYPFSEPILSKLVLDRNQRQRVASIYANRDEPMNFTFSSSPEEQGFAMRLLKRAFLDDDSLSKYTRLWSAQWSSETTTSRRVVYQCRCGIKDSGQISLSFTGCTAHVEVTYKSDNRRSILRIRGTLHHNDGCLEIQLAQFQKKQTQNHHLESTGTTSSLHYPYQAPHFSFPGLLPQPQPTAHDSETPPNFWLAGSGSDDEDSDEDSDMEHNTTVANLAFTTAPGSYPTSFTNPFSNPPNPPFPGLPYYPPTFPNPPPMEDGFIQVLEEPNFWGTDTEYEEDDNDANYDEDEEEEYIIPGSSLSNNVIVTAPNPLPLPSTSEGILNNVIPFLDNYTPQVDQWTSTLAQIQGPVQISVQQREILIAARESLAGLAQDVQRLLGPTLPAPST